jgi:hypothetical protein
MGDYRYSIVRHHGIPCLHVVIDDGREGTDLPQTNIPLEDILMSAYEAGYQPPARQMLPIQIAKKEEE